MTKKTTHNVPPVPADRFTVGVFALLGAPPGQDPAGGGGPASREAPVVAAELFPGDTAMAAAFCSRFYALVEVLDARELAPWRSADLDVSGSVRLHPALLEAAAVLRPNRNGKFPRKKLLARIEAIAAQSYPDWTWEAG